MMQDEKGIIGRTTARTDALQKVSGRARYTEDLWAQDMLVAKELHPPFPHARIISIDTSRAASAPGVVCVLTAKDVIGENSVGHPMSAGCRSRGIHSVNRLPCPGALSRSRRPPWAIARSRAMLSPSPIPCGKRRSAWLR